LTPPQERLVPWAEIESVHARRGASGSGVVIGAGSRAGDRVGDRDGGRSLPGYTLSPSTLSDKPILLGTAGGAARRADRSPQALATRLPLEARSRQAGRPRSELAAGRGLAGTRPFLGLVRQRSGRGVLARGAQRPHSRGSQLPLSDWLEWVRDSGSLASLQELLGHAQLSTTMVYARPSEDIVHDEVRRIEEKRRGA